LERIGAGHSLTARGQERLHHFNVFGCADPGCPLCQGKSRYITCPGCKCRKSIREVKISREKDIFFAVRHAGVYCDHCSKLIFNEIRARLLGIPMEE
jgi:hypothetical protein